MQNKPITPQPTKELIKTIELIFDRQLTAKQTALLQKELSQSILEAKEAQRQSFIELVEKVQKQCSAADGAIDGITALHSLLEELRKDK
jgi:hypothetical protein